MPAITPTQLAVDEEN